LFLNWASDVRGQLHNLVTTEKEVICIPQPVCTFWGRETFVALTGDQTVIFGLPAHHPVNIPASMSLSSAQVKGAEHTNLYVMVLN